MSSGETTDTQPDTQPIEGEDSTFAAPVPPLTWCWLVSLDPVTGQTLAMDNIGDIHQLEGEERRKVGRHSSCDVVLRETLFTGSNNEDIQLNKLSRVQFELFIDNNVIVIEDKSMNGTYVNGVLVGKGGTIRLHHGDVIAVLQRDFKMFRCISEIEMRVLHSTEIVSKYLVGREVGNGSSSVVREGFARDSLVRVAMKFIRKDLWPSKYSEPKDLMNEVNILKRLQHPCITGVIYVLDTPGVFVIILEFVTGGELFDHVTQMTNSPMEEKNAKFFFYQLSHTLAYLHRFKVCHRDLKLENILLSERSSRSQIKVTDFGLAKVFGSQGDVLQTFVGTPVYMAPEVILILAVDTEHPSYTCKSDCWSLGVCLYVLLCGYHPFVQKNVLSIRAKVLSGSYLPMVGDKWRNVSSLAKDLVKGLLNVDPEKRLSARQVLAHPWLTEDPELCREAWLTMGLGEGNYNNTDNGSGGSGDLHQDKKIKFESRAMKQIG